jgi:hypothetical protein
MVSFPSYFLTNKININDQVAVVINSNDNTDTFYFNLTFSYLNQIKANKTYYYPEFTFKIWDLFSDFKPGIP